jgi:cell wall-associated NlpC family hydrolase
VEPLLTPRVPGQLYRHDPNPSDALGVQLVVLRAVAATVLVTATLVAPAIASDGSSYPVRTTIQVSPGMEQTAFMLPGGFTISADTPAGSQACVDVEWSVQGGVAHTARACATVVDAGGMPPVTTPTGDLPATPSTAPCYKAAMAALTKQGALYSQGGNHSKDPRDARGRPLPRTGPNSFDCSGLVWWAYMQAGIPIGSTTESQLNDGVALACTLADLRGAETSCWTLGDLIFLSYPGGRHVAIYAGNGLFMDCYNHQTGCILHDVSKDSFYQKHFYQARRIVSGCEGLTNDPGAPVPPPLNGSPESDAVCTPDGPAWTEDTGVAYSRGCGPPVLPPGPGRESGTKLRQFDGIVGWLGVTGKLWPPGPAGVHLHLGLDIGTQTDMCRWPNQLPGLPEGTVPPGGTFCMTSWADPIQFLPQAHGDTLAVVNGTAVPVALGQAGDPTMSDTSMQLPPPGHPAGLMWPASDPDTPGGTWWSPGNDERANGGRCPLGGPTITNWFSWLLSLILPWLFGC